MGDQISLFADPVIWRESDDGQEFAFFAVCAEGKVHNTTTGRVICFDCRMRGIVGPTGRPGEFEAHVMRRAKR